jgi:predicted dehydrogenase
MLLDFGDNLFALVYGVATGRLTEGFTGTYFGTKGMVAGLTLNGAPLDYPGRELIAPAPNPGIARTWLLPHVVGPHREIEEAHVFEDIMQLVDWVRDGTPSPATAEQARHVIDIFESAYRSAETGHVQELRTTFSGQAAPGLA